MLAKTQYAILGVTPIESPAGLRRVFRRLVKRYHPDRAGYGATATFQRIVEAYRMLELTERRNRHESALTDAAPLQTGSASWTLQPGTEPRAFLPAEVPTIKLEVTSFLPFDSLARQVNQQLHPGHTFNDDDWGPVELSVTLAVDEAARGGVALLDLPAWYPCNACGGTGQAGTAPCEACDGEALELGEERVRVCIPARSSAYTRLELPVPSMGVVGKYLRLHIRVVSSARLEHLRANYT